MISTRTIHNADVALAVKLGQARRDPVTRVAGVLSEVADQAPAVAVCGATLAAGLVLGRPGLAEAGARMLASVLVATAIKSVVKRAVSRTRPHVLLDEGHYEFEAPGRAEGGDEHSFPSGHTADAVAAARGAARAHPAAGGVAYALAGAIAAVQVPRARHYPLDLAGGALVGVVAELLVHRASVLIGEALRRPDDPELGKSRPRPTDRSEAGASPSDGAPAALQPR